MTLVQRILAVASTIVALGQVVSAQWPTHPTGVAPRGLDGKPSLTAPAPRADDGHPDLSGMWQLSPGSYILNVTQDLAAEDIQPWADEQYQQNLDRYGGDQACLLPLGPRYYMIGAPKIVQTPGLIVVLNDDLTYRQIFLDGRQLPRDPNPTFMGYSVGRWEGDTLVVDSIGFNDRTLLDSGHPHSESLHITERFHRRDSGHMEVQVTFTDPPLYAKPMVVSVSMRLIPDGELIEYICRENEKDFAHMAGRRSDKARTIASDVLSRYVGAYRVRLAEGPEFDVKVTLANNHLVIDRTPWIRDRQVLIPLSDTTFEGHFDRQMRFETNADGTAARLVFIHPDPAGAAVVATKVAD